MTPEERQVLGRLRGTHQLDERERGANWLAIWLFVAGTMCVVGLLEAFARGTTDLGITFLTTSVGIGTGLASAAYIRAMNQSRYVVDETSISRVAGWPLRRWSIAAHEIRRLSVQPARRHWMLKLETAPGETKSLVLTRSMCRALDLIP